MTIIFEPLIRTEDELTDVLEALRIEAKESRELATHAAGTETRLNYERHADRLSALIASIERRYSVVKRA